jgi:hypothetical protein
MKSAASILRIGDLLDSQFALLRGELETSKSRSVLELARIFAAERVPYVVIRGVAVQLWSSDPRTTLDLDVAVRSCDALPREALVEAGFAFGRRFAHSENWTGPDGAPVQFTDDPAFAAAIDHPEERPLAGHVLRLMPVFELVRAKLRSADDPERRRSKRVMDLADALALSEQHPDVLTKLDADERRRLDS